MNRTIVIVGIAAIILIIGSYAAWSYYAWKRCGDNCLFPSPSSPTTPDQGSDTIYQKLNGISIGVPDQGGASVVLASHTVNGKTEISGTWRDPVEEAHRVTATFPADTVTTQIATEGTVTWYVIPFFVNSGGSGTFLSLGLFSLRDNVLAYHSSISVADRVTINSITRTGNSVTLRYLTRHANQPMSATASAPAFMIVTRSGETILEAMSGVNAEPNEITVSTPKAQSTTSKIIATEGNAPGTWYFEASFPISIEDPTGKALGQKFATAQSDWMTTNLVPFKGSVTVTGNYTGPAFLKIKNDNPSGEPERDKYIRIPITIR